MGAVPENFGHGEYEDVPDLLVGLHEIGSFPILFTLGSREHATGEPGWQERKVLSAPNLRYVARHIAEGLPEGGKGERIGTWYDRNNDIFLIPRTDGGESVVSIGAVLVDDVEHNVESMPAQALGILLDRKGKHEGSLPSNVCIVRSLKSVPAIVSDYAAMRRDK